MNMKPNELREIIKKLVEEEVKKELPKLLFEMLMKKQVVSHDVVNNKPVNTNTINSSVEKQNNVTKVKKEVKYTNNELLNKILNETTPGFPQSPYGSTLVQLSDNGFNKVGGEEISYINEPSKLVSENVNTNISMEPLLNNDNNISTELTESPSVSNLTNVFQRDYRTLMKAIDKRNMQKHGAA